MSFFDLLSIAGAVSLSLGGGAAIVFALSKWLGGVWAARILASEEAQHQREFEALVRRRDIYSKLATTLRVLLKRHEHDDGPDLRGKFLETYDEASVWAPDAVMNAVGRLLDLLKSHSAAPDFVEQSELQQAYIDCMTEMRKDSGFKSTTFEYRVVSF
ncbi:MAG: hypothetical protein HYU86_05050 [Chloroflexi bacterium]|nr:hypothetical protein [Chloroflexota bacterium]